MRFAPEADHGANAGLKLVRDLLEPVKEKFPGLSYSDLWTLAGVCAVQEMAGPKIPWRSGRQDGLVEHCTPDGRLPDGDKGSDHLRYIFYKVSSSHLVLQLELIQLTVTTATRWVSVTRKLLRFPVRTLSGDAIRIDLASPGKQAFKLVRKFMADR